MVWDADIKRKSKKKMLVQNKTTKLFRYDLSNEYKGWEIMELEGISMPIPMEG